MNKAQREALAAYHTVADAHWVTLRQIDDLHSEFGDMVEQYERRLDALHNAEVSSWQIVECKISAYVAACE